MASATSNGSTNGTANGAQAASASRSGSSGSQPDYEVIIIGAGVAGIYQMYRLAERGVHATVLENGQRPRRHLVLETATPAAASTPRATPTATRSPTSCSRSGHWKEALLGPARETCATSTTWADKFRPAPVHAVSTAPSRNAPLGRGTAGIVGACTLGDGRDLSCRFLLTALGLLSAPHLPPHRGACRADGNRRVSVARRFHTYHWPAEPVEINGKRVGGDRPPAPPACRPSPP